MTSRLIHFIGLCDAKRREFFKVQADYYRCKAELQYMHNLYMSACSHDEAMAASKFPKGGEVKG